jgi:hypothetical protein
MSFLSNITHKLFRISNNENKSNETKEKNKRNTFAETIISKTNSFDSMKLNDSINVKEIEKFSSKLKRRSIGNNLKNVQLNDNLEKKIEMKKSLVIKNLKMMDRKKKYYWVFHKSRDIPLIFEDLFRQYITKKETTKLQFLNDNFLKPSGPYQDNFGKDDGEEASHLIQLIFLLRNIHQEINGKFEKDTVETLKEEIRVIIKVLKPRNFETEESRQFKLKIESIIKVLKLDDEENKIDDEIDEKSIYKQVYKELKNSVLTIAIDNIEKTIKKLNVESHKQYKIFTEKNEKENNCKEINGNNEECKYCIEEKKFYKEAEEAGFYI